MSHERCFRDSVKNHTRAALQTFFALDAPSSRASHIVSKPWERSTVRSLALVKYVHDILLDRCGARGARSARRGARGVGSSR
jgi:hypothetical protein